MKVRVNDDGLCVLSDLYPAWCDHCLTGQRTLNDAGRPQVAIYGLD